jgi:hypothetical protein
VSEPADSNKPNANDAAYWEQRQFKVQKIIAYAGVLGIVIYAFQLYYMKQSTDAATRANKTALEMAHLDQRSWVSTLQQPNSEPPQVGAKFVIRIPIRNTGKTFARRVAMDCQLQIVKAGKKIDFEMPKKPGAGPPLNNLLLSPSGEYTFTFTTAEPLSDKEVEQFKSLEVGQAVLYGYITYYDIFDCVHWTVFCFKLLPEHWNWEISNEHNAADNDRCDETPAN